MRKFLNQSRLPGPYLDCVWTQSVLSQPSHHCVLALSEPSPYCHEFMWALLTLGKELTVSTFADPCLDPYLTLCRPISDTVQTVWIPSEMYLEHLWTLSRPSSDCLNCVGKQYKQYNFWTVRILFGPYGRCLCQTPTVRTLSNLCWTLSKLCMDPVLTISGLCLDKVQTVWTLFRTSPDCLQQKPIPN